MSGRHYALLPGPRHELPEGFFELRNALSDEVADAERRYRRVRWWQQEGPGYASSAGHLLDKVGAADIASVACRTVSIASRSRFPLAT
jgi:hypothetical protein